MPADVRVISSRRGLEMPSDGIRLSAICTEPVMGMLRGAFQFQVSQIGTPMQTLGPVPVTLPPGAVFNLGSMVNDAGALIPIRFLHFEPRRVVVDVAGPSEVIDAVWSKVQAVLGEVVLPDSAPVLVEPSGAVDSSEISVRLDIGPHGALAPEFVAAARAHGADLANCVAAAVLQSAPANEEYQGAGPGQYALQLRAGTLPSDGIYYSAAPLTSSEHLTYLSELETSLAKNPR